MAQEQTHTVKGGVEMDRGTAEGHNGPGAEVPQSARESKTRGILRDAIRKVMEEIEHHEAEGKRHFQLAADLRKDLRESIRFLQEQGDIETRSNRSDATHQPLTEETNEKRKDSPSSKRKYRRRK
jgi:hypothetical protein